MKLVLFSFLIPNHNQNSKTRTVYPDSLNFLIILEFTFIRKQIYNYFCLLLSLVIKNKANIY